jgi:hypothetical protein
MTWSEMKGLALSQCMKIFGTDRLKADLACVATFSDPRGRISKVQASKGANCRTLSYLPCDAKISRLQASEQLLT